MNAIANPPSTPRPLEVISALAARLYSGVVLDMHNSKMSFAEYVQAKHASEFQLQALFADYVKYFSNSSSYTPATTAAEYLDHESVFFPLDVEDYNLPLHGEFLMRYLAQQDLPVALDFASHNSQGEHQSQLVMRVSFPEVPVGKVKAAGILIPAPALSLQISLMDNQLLIALVPPEGRARPLLNSRQGEFNHCRPVGGEQPFLIFGCTLDFQEEETLEEYKSVWFAYSFMPGETKVSQQRVTLIEEEHE